MGYDAYFYRVKRKTSGPCVIDNSSNVNEISELLNNAWNTFDSQVIDSWCSNGRYWVDSISQLVPSYLKSKNGDIIIRSASAYKELCKAVIGLMNQVQIRWGLVEYALTDRADDGSFRCTPVDGVMVRMDDGIMKQGWNDCEEEFLIPNIEPSIFTTVWEFIRAVFNAADTDWETEFLLLGGSY